jgi:hypothetical protein
MSEIDPNSAGCPHRAHLVQGAKFGVGSAGNAEETTWCCRVVCCGIPRLDLCRVGHIHKAQNLNEGNHAPVIYPVRLNGLILAK